MATNVSVAVTATAAATCTALVRSGSANIRQLQLSLASVTGATLVTFNVYDNNVASSVTLGTGATWSGKSPGYSGQGPNTEAFGTEGYQSARFGNQQGQTAPNGAGVVQYWPTTLATGNLDYAAAPTVKTAGTILADGDGAFLEQDSSNATGNVVAAVTAARLLYSVTLAAGASDVFIPLSSTEVTYGVDVVASASGATAIAGTATLTYDPLP